MEVDFAIVGGGSAGAVLARRLAEAGIGTVALIEAGQPDDSDPTQMDVRRLGEQPAELDWGFRAARLADGPEDLRYARARTLGGCGNHNDCAWLVPPDEDFDRWQALGAAGWGAADLRPAFARVSARVGVAARPADHPVTAALLDAAEALGLPRRDFTGGIAAGAGMMPLNADGRQRNSPSVAYLHPLSALPRTLALVTGALVTGLRFDGRRVVGCETTRGLVTVRREVILAAGSIGSPHLLMVSGIGDPEVLKAAGVPVRVALPGVGRNLADHASASVVFRLREPVPDHTVTPYESVMLLDSTGRGGPPDCLVHFGLVAGSPSGRDWSGGCADGADGRLVDLAPNVMRPKSRGRVSLVGPDLRDGPRIALDYFSDPEGEDLRVLRAALRFCRRIAGTAPIVGLGAVEMRPAAEADTDDGLDAYIRETCETVYHACGTCRIGAAGDPAAVVAPDLGVRGVQGLRVCDASVFPDIVGVNIHSTVLAVAERGAAIVAEATRSGTACPAVAAGAEAERPA